MRRSIKLLLATVATLAVMCSGAWAATPVTDSGPTNWGNGEYEVTGSVTINGRIKVTGSVTLMLTDGCTLTASSGITVNAGNELIIKTPDNSAGTGELIANTYDGHERAAIGGAATEPCGKITIYGGKVTATTSQTAGLPGQSAAAIGGGSGGGGGTITITGGTVIATNKAGGVAIGGGISGSIDSITITGGNVTATSEYGAAIGGGSGGGGGTITITGGKVTAISKFGKGIGGGYNAADDGTLSSGANGNAWIETNSVGAETAGFVSGVLFDGNDGRVYGPWTVRGDVSIPSGATLDVPAGASLTIPAGATLDATKGTLANGGGTITNNGTVDLSANTNISNLKMTGSGTVEMGGVRYNTSGQAYHTIKVTYGSGGTAGASASEDVVQGTQITLTSSPDIGYELEKWNVVQPTSGLTIPSQKNVTFNMPDANVEINATFKPLPPGEYPIIVSNDGNGIGTADPTVASKDIIVTLTSSPDPGYEFDAWVAVSPTSLDISNDKFTMPDEAVTVKATFKALPPTPTPDPSPMPTPAPTPDPTPSYIPGKYTDAIDRDRSDTLWNALTGGDMTIYINVDLAKFDSSVSLDGVPLVTDTATVSNDFGAHSGSTIVTIWERTLKEKIKTDGEHRAEIGFKDGSAIHTFMVRGTGETPPQKQNTSGGACAAGAAAFVAVAALAMIKRRKR